MTKACHLACFHCRANAQEAGGSDELSTDEGFALIDTLAAIGRPRPILILTGGDCLMREDLVRIATHAALAKVPIAYASLRDRLIERLGPSTAPIRAPSAATRDGKGIVFVAANGEVNRPGFPREVFESSTMR